MRTVIPPLLAVLIAFAAMGAASQFVAHVFHDQRALGPSLRLGPMRLYPPWSVLNWDRRWSFTYPRPFAVARLVLLSGAAAAVCTVALGAKQRFGIKPFGRAAWASREDVAEAKLFSSDGAVLGRFGDELMCFDGPEHQILIGASRSGKGRGHVAPTLLATRHSMLVLDIKGELADGDPRIGFPGTAGFRERLGPVLRFAPTDAASVRFNPLFEVRRGANEVRDVQNLMDVLFAAHEDGREKDFWARSAANIAAPVALHVLYSEPVERKTLAVVRQKLARLSATAEEMRRTLHRLSPVSGAPEVHPEILHGAESFLAGEERMRSGIQATAESMFGLFADPVLAANTQTSDFRIGDLMAHERPVTLYLQPPSSDAPRLMPLLRTIIDLTGRGLMESQTHDAQGRPKRHRLVLMLDEFPALGRLSFFETMMGAMAGYGLKVSIVCQSLNHLRRAYGRDNVILDNCHIVTAFSAADGDTARRIAEMAGEVWEVRESQSENRPRPLLGWVKGSKSLREERRPLLLAGDVRALPRDQQLIFVAGVKPIRAQKLKFDEEAIFSARVIGSKRERVQLSTSHDWMEVRALGQIEPAARKPPQKPGPASRQGDLFAARKAGAASIEKHKSKGV